MLEAALAHPQVGVVGAVLRYPDGRIQHAGGFVRTMGRHIWDNAIRNRAPFWTARSTWRILRRRSRFLNHYTKVDERQRLDFLTGACILIPRRTVEAIGRFDEGYEFSFEDVDYCLRALEAGLELALATEARGVHLERATGERTGPTIDRSFDRYASLWKAGRIRKVIRRRRRVGVYHAPGGPCGCPPRPS
jgi:O-antigen biosynthesis protein